MTQQHPQPQRCIHECVCHSYLDYQSDDLDPCLAKKCEHDTRPHTPAAPAAELSSKWCWEYPDCEKCKTSTMCSLCPCKKKCDDARKAEREKVLDAVIKECETAREENRKIGRATVDQVGKEHWRGRAVGNREIKEYAESLRGGGAP